MRPVLRLGKFANPHITYANNIKQVILEDSVLFSHFGVAAPSSHVDTVRIDRFRLRIPSWTLPNCDFRAPERLNLRRKCSFGVSGLFYFQLQRCRQNFHGNFIEIVNTNHISLLTITSYKLVCSVLRRSTALLQRHRSVSLLQWRMDADQLQSLAVSLVIFARFCAAGR